MGTNLVFAQTHLIVDRTVVHFKKRNVVFVGELVKVPVGDNLPDLSVNVAVGFVGVEHMILPDPHQEVTGGNVLTMEDTNNSKPQTCVQNSDAGTPAMSGLLDDDFLDS